VENQELGIREYLSTLRRRKWIIILTVVVVVGATFGYVITQPSVYASTAGLLLIPQYGTSAQGAVVSLGPASIDIPTETALVTSGPVTTVVEKKLGIGYAPPVSVVQQGTTDILDISATASSAELAQDIANAYATAYIQVRQQQQQAGPLGAEQQVQAQLDQLNSQLTTLQGELATASVHPGAESITLSNQITEIQGQINTTTDQLNEIKLVASLNSVSGQLVNPAVIEPIRISPDPKRDLALAALAGLLLGIGLAFLREFFDDHIRTKADLERVIPGLPALGLVPEIEDWKDRETPYLISVRRPRSPQAEAYRNLRTAIQFMGIDNPIRTLQFTSAVAGDGKTVTTANLAIAMASAGLRVTAMSCDLRRPRLHAYFGLSNAVGLTSVLLGNASLDDALIDFQGQGRILILPSGPIPPNPSELLAGARASEVFSELKRRSDIVLVDSPPVIPITDASVLASRVDAVLMVATAGHSTGRTIKNAIDVLGQVDAPLVGFVLNKASRNDGYTYDYRYSNADDSRNLVGEPAGERG